MEKAKQIPYRAIALDLDGTLTNHEKVVTPKTREALLQAASQGAVIILASGRPTYGIEPVAECLELQKRGGYILSYNGGNIVNAQTGEKLFTQFLPDEVIPILYKYAREKNHALLGYAGNEIITEMPDDQYVKEESRINKMNIRKVENLLEALEPHPTKLLMTAPHRICSRLNRNCWIWWAIRWTSSARLLSSWSWCLRESTRRSR